MYAVDNGKEKRIRIDDNWKLTEETRKNTQKLKINQNDIHFGFFEKLIEVSSFLHFPLRLVRKLHIYDWK